MLICLSLLVVGLLFWDIYATRQHCKITMALLVKLEEIMDDQPEGDAKYGESWERG